MKRVCVVCGKDMRSAEQLGTEIHVALAEKGFIPRELSFEGNGVCGEACAIEKSDAEDLQQQLESKGYG